MGCGFCEEYVTSLLVGLVSVVSFIAISAIEILFASFKLFFERLRKLE